MTRNIYVGGAILFIVVNLVFVTINGWAPKPSPNPPASDWLTPPPKDFDFFEIENAGHPKPHSDRLSPSPTVAVTVTAQVEAVTMETVPTEMKPPSPSPTPPPSQVETGPGTPEVTAIVSQIAQESAEPALPPLPPPGRATPPASYHNYSSSRFIPRVNVYMPQCKGF